MQAAGWTLLGITALLAARYGVILCTLRRLRLAPASAGEHLALDALPSAHAELLALAAPRLSALGFTPQYVICLPASLLTSKPCPRYATAWLHEGNGAWAVVALNEQPEYAELYVVDFATYYAQSPHLFTTARRAHEFLIVHPAVEFVDSAASLDEQWHSHLERMRARATEPVLRNRPTLEAVEQRLPIEARAAAIAQGVLIASEGGAAHFSWRGAWLYMRRCTQAMQALRKTPLAPAQANGVDLAAPAAPALRATADTIAMQRQLAARRISPGPRYKGLLLLATMLVSLRFFGWQFDSRFSVVLVAVLLLHELGHLLAMRWAGYRYLQVFFIPLFGAVASGREVQVSAWDKTMVLLAGPVPGIVLGCALLEALARHALPPDPWLLSAVTTLLLINVFNLLPLLPLDGGRLFDLLLLTRLPRLRGAFAALGAAGLVGFGLWSHAPLAVVLGVALALGLPAQFRHARWVSALRAVHRDGIDSDDRWLHAFTRLLVAPGERPLAYRQRLALAQMLSRSEPGPPPSLATVVAGLLLYATALLLPVCLLARHGVELLPAVVASFSQHSAAVPPRDFETELMHATSAAALVEIANAAGAEAEVEEDFERAAAYYLRASNAARQLPTDNLPAVDAVLGLARTAEDGKTARAMLAERLPALTALESTVRLKRAEVLAVLGMDFYGEVTPQSLKRMREAVAIRAELLAPDSWGLLEARRDLAWQLWRAQRSAEAIAELRKRLQALVTSSCDSACEQQRGWLREQAYADLGWLLLSLRQSDAVLRLAQEFAAAPRASSAATTPGTEAVTVLNAWARYQMGDGKGAMTLLTTLLEHDPSSRSAMLELQILIDLAIFAEAQGDATAAAQWAATLRERAVSLRQKQPWLSLQGLANGREAPYAWQKPRIDAEAAWLAKHQPQLLVTPK